MKRAVCWNLLAGAAVAFLSFALAFAFESVEGRGMDVEACFFLMLILSGMMYPIPFVLTWVIDQRAVWTFGDILGRLLVAALSPLVMWVVLGIFCAASSVVCELIEDPRAELIEDPRAVSYVIGLLLHR